MENEGRKEGGRRIRGEPNKPKVTREGKGVAGEKGEKEEARRQGMKREGTDSDFHGFGYCKAGKEASSAIN